MKAGEKLKKSITTDNLWLYILSALTKAPSHAYALRDKIRGMFGWEPELITLYVVLYRIEGEGLIKGKASGRKKVYEITDNGKRALGGAKRMLAETVKRL